MTSSISERSAAAPAAAPGEALGRAPAECIFIVGASRSGTTLMRRTLNESDQIAIAAENHYMGHLIAGEGMRHKFRRFGDLRDDANVRRLVGHIYSDGLARGSRLRGVSTQWRWLVRNVPQEAFLQRLLRSDRSERALFEALMRAYAEQKRKPIIGEKTPAHVRYVPTLLAWFPGARVVHMLRDPRAVFVSELRRRRAEPDAAPYRQLRRVPPLLTLYVLLQTTLAWLESARRCADHRRRFGPRYCALRFEDLVRDPDGSIRHVCAFLGVPFQERMLEQDVVSKGFQAGQSGFDAQAADRWRAHIAPWADRWFRLVLGAPMRALGYEEPAHGS